MASAGVPALGPQCLSCKRRRVKCDSATPSCRRCERDDIACPGYTKQLKWIAVQNSKKRTNRLATSSAEQYIASCPLAFPESLEDRESRLLCDSSDFYNIHVLPDMVPAHRPFKRNDQIARDWTAAPRVLRNLLIVLVKGIQRSKSFSEPSTELFKYRALALADLKCSLEQAVADPHGMVLSGVLLLMGIDLMNSHLEQWTWLYHFKAARRIIELRGGFSDCFFGLPHSQGLLFKYMMIDVFTMTTCNTSEISKESAESQQAYIPVTTLRRQVDGGHMCPQPLLQAIVNTTMLRTHAQRIHHGDCGSLQTSLSFGDVLDDIGSFDALAWADDVLLCGITRPYAAGEASTRAARYIWQTLALAYQYGVQLYLVCSIRAPITDEDRACLTIVQQGLARQIKHLFSVASADVDGPIESRCWKYALWPSFVSSIVSICWYCQDDEQVERELQTLQNSAEALHSSALLRMSDFLRNMASRRVAHVGSAWTWNDIFQARSAFVVC
jgi:hypothetical protein